MEFATGFKRYLLNPESKVQNLKAQLDRLRNERDGRLHSIEAAKAKGEEIDEGVQSWVTRAEEKIKEEEETLEDLEAEAKKRCFIGLCPNFKSFDQLNKRAEDNTKAVLELIQQVESHKFNNVSNIQKSENQAEAEKINMIMDVEQDKKTSDDTEDISGLKFDVEEKIKKTSEGRTENIRRALSPYVVIDLTEDETEDIGELIEPHRFYRGSTQGQSGTATLEKIMKALKEDSGVKILGVYGMTDVDKTMLVKEVDRRAREERLFDEVVMATVARSLNIKEILGKIEETTGLKFDMEGEFARARRANPGLKGEDTKVLLVLDDIWLGQQLELEEIWSAFLGYQNMKKVSEDASQKFYAVRFKMLLTSTARELVRLERGSTQGYVAFQSRKGTLQNIMKALKDPSGKIICVHGMTGVGKTMLVKEAASRARKARLFDEVVMATLSRNQNMKEILGKIADAIGQKFDEESVFARAMRLQQWLKKKDMRVLLILDDILPEQRLELEEIGNAFEGYQNIASKKDLGPLTQNADGNAFQKFSAVRFKILLTSTTQEVVHDMKTTRMIKVDVLTGEEAMAWFRIILGNAAKRPAYQQILPGVVEHCAGFPVAISAIGIALRTWGFNFLQDAFKEEDKIIPTKEKKLRSVFLTIKLVYSLFFNVGRTEQTVIEKEFQSFFQLCSLLTQGSDIHVSDLLKYSLVLKIARSISTLEEARKSVNKLKDAGLLLTSDNEMVKVHDIVRDVSIWIASEEKRIFVIEDDSHMNDLLKQGNLRNCSAISLPYGNILQLPPKLECPRLKLILFSNKNPLLAVPDPFFQEMNELLVLDLAGMNFPSLPPSFSSLRNLQMLCLNDCKLNDVRNIGYLEQLNTLRIHNSDIQRLPQEIGRLKLLKLLDLSNCSKLQIIPANIISSLSNLEELFMRNSFDRWGVGDNASLSELQPLSRLTTLVVHIRSAQVMPAELFSEKLDRYKILIGEVWDWHGKYEKDRMLKLKLIKKVQLDHGVKLLVQKSEDLYLDELKGVKNLLYELDDTGFPRLKNLYIQNGSEIQFIVNSTEMRSLKAFPILESLFLQNLINLEKICHGKLEEESFKTLKTISVKSCDGLKNLFPFSMTKMLLQLQEIKVKNCKSIEEIVVEEREKRAGIAANKTEFRQLRSLTLQLLPELSSFCSKEKNCSIYQLEPVNPRPWLLFNEKVVFPVLESLCLSLINIERIWQKTSYCSQNLTTLVIESCGNLKHLLSPSIMRSLLQLKRFDIIDCKLIREIIVPEEEEEEEKNAKILFPQLNSLKMKNLRNLVGFCSEKYFLQFPSLKLLEIENCPQLKEFMHKTLSTDITTVNGTVEINIEEDDHFGPQALFNTKVAFPNLEKLKIFHLKTVKMIYHSPLPTDSFSKLEEMKVGHCSELFAIFPSNTVRAFQGLNTLTVINCDSLRHIFEIKVSDIKDINPAAIQLRELYFFHLPKLEHVWNEDPQGILTFPSIRMVYVRDCWSLKSLFPVSVAKGLQELEDLTIDSCGLEEVVSNQEEMQDFVNKFVFPQVCSLTLWNLPRLKYFYSAVSETEWSKLKQLKTYHCGHEKLLGIEEHESLIPKPLVWFEKVIHNLEELSLSSKDISIIHNCQFQASQVKVLQLLCYHDKSAVFPFSLLQEFNNLVKLEVICCEFKELFSIKGDASEKKPAIILQQVKKLKLVSLPNLNRVWGQNSQLDQIAPNLEVLEAWRCDGLISLGSSSASFQNLTALDMWQCKGIVTLITSSAARNLVQLVKMRIKECIMVTEIVAAEEYDEKDMISFTKLKCMELHYVPNLTTFCSGKCSFQFPSLEQIIVRQCPKLKIFCQGVLSTPQLHRVQLAEEDYKGFWAGDLNTTINQFHENTVRSFEPEYLKLHEFPELEEIWNKMPRGIMDFKRLKSLEVCNCNNLRYIFTASIAMDLAELQRIKVKDCRAIEEIIRDVKTAINKITFPQLSSVTLKSCLGLASFFVGSCALECPNLKELTVVDCPKMIAFASTVGPFFSDKVSLPVLKDLTIINMENLERLWDDRAMVDSFFKLEHFKLHRCVKLPNIFSLNMVRRLQRLKTLEIVECASLEEIFEPESTEAEINTKLVFPQVTYLNLSMLPKLKSFYSRMHATEWPSLRKMDVYGCDKVEIFALERPNSKETQKQSQLLPIQIPLFWVNKVTFPCLEELRLECNGIMKEIWHGQIPEGYLKLKVVELIKFPAQVTVLPSSFFRSLSNLENFAVSDASFYEIFHCEELSGKDEQERALARLSRLRLSHLHELTHLWKEDIKPRETFCNMRALEVHDCGKLNILVPSSVSFENLTTLEVSRCHGLKHLIPQSTAKSLVQLTRMSVTYCQMIEEIIACSGDEVKEGIVFTRLKCLGLSFLPNLASFCSGNCTFEFPLLEIVTLRHCPKMKTFPRERLSTPKLQFVYSNEAGGEERWEGDWNTSIQLLFMETVTYRAIEYLVLSDTSKLMEIWNWNPQGILDFKNLKFLKVYNCRNLTYAFNPSMAMDLVHLEKLEIHDCEMLEEVIITYGLPKKERMSQKMFPKLVFLLFNALPNLTRFCSGNYFEFPSLKELWIQSCPTFETFISSSVTRNISGQNLHTDLTALFEEKVAFPSLEKLGIINIRNQRKICNDHLSTDSFSKLKVLKLMGLPKKSDVLPSCFFLSLSKLERLVIVDASFTEIFQYEVVGGKAQARELPDFSDLRLSKLPELTHLCKEDFQSQAEILFQNLRILKILECPKLKSLGSSTMCFQNLTTLEVSKCHGFINLMTPSIAGSMVQLERMRITDCQMIEEIIAGVGEKDGIIFKQLVCLELQRLPCLGSFCSGYHHFDLPSLVEFVATECPKFGVFSEGGVTTPSLQKICLTGEEFRPLNDQDLNSIIKGSCSKRARNDVKELEFLEWT